MAQESGHASMSAHGPPEPKAMATPAPKIFPNTLAGRGVQMAVMQTKLIAAITPFNTRIFRRAPRQAEHWVVCCVYRSMRKCRSLLRGGKAESTPSAHLGPPAPHRTSH